MEKLGDTIKEILAGKIKTMQREPLQECSLSEDLSKYDCKTCKDAGFIFYRIHKDVKPPDLKENGMPKDPDMMILESDFFNGKVDPMDAYLWTTKFSELCSCRERKAKERKMESLLSTSNLSPKFKKRTFETLYFLDPYEFPPTDREMVKSMMRAQRTAMEMAKAFCENWSHHKEHGEGIGLFGDVGTAKTHILAAKTNYLVSKGVQSVQVNTQELFDEIRSTFEIGPDGKPTGKKRSSEILDLLKKCEDLSFDDVGTETPTDWVREKFYEILNYRYEYELSTSFSTNNTNEELKIHLGKSYRRLIEPCMGRMINIKGVSFEQLLLRRSK